MLANKPRLMTEFDLRRLDALFQRVRGQVKPPATLSSLEREVELAVCVRPEEVPADVVTINSEVEVLDVDAKEPRRLKLVLPSGVGAGPSCVSVLAPLGSALLGSQAGARVSYQSPRGPRELRVVRVLFQPEAAGRFDL